MSNLSNLSALIKSASAIMTDKKSGITSMLSKLLSLQSLLFTI